MIINILFYYLSKLQFRSGLTVNNGILDAEEDIDGEAVLIELVVAVSISQTGLTNWFACTHLCPANGSARQADKHTS